jgi:aspartate/methionine/tyrosine aminotransferase
MKIEIFEMERMQSTWENIVEHDMSESGITPVTLNELVAMGFDLAGVMDMPLGYSQSNGTPELRELLTKVYPGASVDQIEVTNGTSEANYLIALSLLKPGDEFALEIPNYLQLWGVPKSLGAKLNTFRLRSDRDWEPDWEEFEKAVNPKTKLVYLSNPNNPTGSVLSEAAMRRIADRCSEVGAYLISDEVYLGAELDDRRTPSFWGLSDRVIVTSGLSKAYGIPGVRIGWMVGPQEVVYGCWTQHDYITIGPNKLSDRIAQVAVRLDIREKLYARTRGILKKNIGAFREWVNTFGDFFTFKEPQAGPICFLKYKSEIPSLDIAQRMLKNRSTLIVPGSHFGLEGYIRIWLAGKNRAQWEEALGRIGEELRLIAAGS